MALLFHFVDDRGRRMVEKHHGLVLSLVGFSNYPGSKVKEAKYS
jgi:hypothetical protein